MNVGKKIKAFREANGLSQDQLAALIHKSKSSVQKYENGETSITVDILEDIARALDISMINFFTDDTDDILLLVKERFNLKDNSHGQLEYDFKILMEVLKLKYK